MPAGSRRTCRRSEAVARKKSQPQPRRLPTQLGGRRAGMRRRRGGGRLPRQRRCGPERTDGAEGQHGQRKGGTRSRTRGGVAGGAGAGLADSADGGRWKTRAPGQRLERPGDGRRGGGRGGETRARERTAPVGEGLQDAGEARRPGLDGPSERGKARVGRASRGEAATARRMLRDHGWPRATGVTERAGKAFATHFGRA